MKLIHPVRPMTRDHHDELEHEYELQKQRLLGALDSLRGILKENSSPSGLIARFPFESALMMAFVGFALGQKIHHAIGRRSTVHEPGSMVPVEPISEAPTTEEALRRSPIEAA